MFKLAATVLAIAAGAAFIDSTSPRHGDDVVIGMELGQRYCAEPALARGLYNLATGPGSHRNTFVVGANYYRVRLISGCL